MKTALKIYREGLYNILGEQVVTAKQADKLTELQKRTNILDEETKLFNRLKRYAGKYQISFQLWGEDNNQIYIQKDDVDLWDCGNEKTPMDAMRKAVKYLDRINKKNKKALHAKQPERNNGM